MQHDTLLKMETGKSVADFVRDLEEAGRRYGFIIHNEDRMDMARSFGSHGVSVAEGFDLHMVQVCKPEKAARSLSANPERAILMPKFIMVFSKEDRTQIRFMEYGQEEIRSMIDDEVFPGSLAETYAAIRQMIAEAA